MTTTHIAILVSLAAINGAVGFAIAYHEVFRHLGGVRKGLAKDAVTLGWPKTIVYSVLIILVTPELMLFCKIRNWYQDYVGQYRNLYEQLTEVFEAHGDDTSDGMQIGDLEQALEITLRFVPPRRMRALRKTLVTEIHELRIRKDQEEDSEQPLEHVQSGSPS